MVRALISAALVFAASACFAQAFGRFGYTNLPQVPGFMFTEESFRTRASGSDSFSFLRALPLKRVSTTAEVTKYSSGVFAGTPQGVTVNLRSPGFELDCPLGLELKLSTLSSPNLTVPGATYGAETPTPPSSWVLVSFADKQPPVLLVFLDGAGPEVVVKGRSGEWKLKTVGLYKGKVRICLPFGLQSLTANTVGTLGALSQKLQSQESLWTQPAPSLVSRTIVEEPDALRVTWMFDREGAIVPPSAVLCKAAGYKVKTESPVVDSGAALEDGPVVFCRESSLTLSFPMVRIPTGRALALGTPGPPRQLSAPPLGLGETCELTMSNLTAGRAATIVDEAHAALEEYFSKSLFAIEPGSQSQLPYGADGRGMDFAAAHAFLTQGLSLSQGETATANSLLTSLLWRMDPLTWRFWAADRVTASRAAAIASMAAALDPEPTKRIEAALLHAGLCAESALPKFTQRLGLPVAEAAPSAPLVGLRNAIFQTGAPDPAASEYLKTLTSDVRVVSVEPVVAVSTPRGIEVTWTPVKAEKKQLVFLLRNQTRVAKVSNLKRLTFREQFGVLRVDYQPAGAGPCKALLIRPKWAAPLPTLSAPPAFEK
ncbi:MAG: hypothetical protein JSS66_10615 [Armatimonadetes bacterium]|nr:hypothetical protein [Armatimonadota bacterium]